MACKRSAVRSRLAPPQRSIFFKRIVILKNLYTVLRNALLICRNVSSYFQQFHNQSGYTYWLCINIHWDFLVIKVQE